MGIDPYGLKIKSDEEGLRLVKETLKRLGEQNLAATLYLAENGEISIEGTSMLPTWVPAARRDRIIKLLFKALIDQRLDYELIIERNPDLVTATGGRHPEPQIRRGNYKSKIELDPEIISKSRLRREDGTWVDADVRASFVHEVAHAWFTMEKRLRSTMRDQYNVGPTDSEAVEFEDLYRQRVGLPLRGDHGLGVYCPSGDWESEDCQARLWCGPRPVRSYSPQCIVQWREHRGRLKQGDGGEP